MKATDLMIGDLVLRKNKPMQILDIKENGSVRLGFEDGWIGESVTFIKPIPLTPEILEKNFRRDKCWTGAYYINESIHIYYEQDDDVWTIQYMEIVDLRYVHELQHALKLCKINKGIVL